MNKVNEKPLIIEISHLQLHFIERIKKLRKDKGISQEELSTKMGISEKFVQKVENPTQSGKYNIDHLYSASKALDVNLKELWPDENANIHYVVKAYYIKKFSFAKEGIPSKKFEWYLEKTEPVNRNLF